MLIILVNRTITIGDTYTDSYSTHQLGKDPTGRSFAYDILGNLRTTNDIGASGDESSTNGYTGLKVFLEAAYIGEGEMNTAFKRFKFITPKSALQVSPWNIDDNSIITNLSDKLC